MARWWVPLATLALLAGCEDAGRTLATLPPSATFAGPALVSETEGAIDGLVVHASFLPAADATVRLREPQGAGKVLRDATTGPDGRFVFERVAPGAYRVTAAGAGLVNATQLVTVTAAAVAKVQITLDAAPSAEPYVDIGTQAGLISCAFAVVLVSGVCLPYQTEPVFGPFKVELRFPVPVDHRAVVSETAWADRQQVMRNWFFVNDTGGDWMGDTTGTPVLRKEFRPGEVPSSFYHLPDSVPRPFPPDAKNFTLESVTYYDGAYQKTVNDTGGPACQYTLVGYCTGVGVILQARYDQYVSTFVHAAPASLSSYTAIRD